MAKLLKPFFFFFFFFTFPNFSASVPVGDNIVELGDSNLVVSKGTFVENKINASIG